MSGCILRLARIPEAYLPTDSVDVFESPERVADCPRREPCLLNKPLLRECPFMLKNHENEFRARWEVGELLVGRLTH